MLKLLSRIILFIQILNICFSSNKLLKTSLLENNTSQMAFLPKPQNQEITNFLIYPYPNTFKEYILPFVSSKNAIKLFLHFQTLNSNIKFEAFLPPTRFITVYPVLTLQETESLYRFDNNEYPLFTKPIWFSKKNKLPKIVDYFFTNFQLDSTRVFAVFSGDEIRCLTKNRLPACSRFWASKNVETQEFFVALKKDDNTFVTLANGKIFTHNMDFSEHLQVIWDAYNLKGLKKYFLKMIYFLQVFCLLPYSKYYFSLLRGFLHMCEKFPWTWDVVFDCINILGYVSISVLFFLFFHFALLPFHIMATPFYISTQNCGLIMYLPEVLFLIHALFFPQLVEICVHPRIIKHGNFDALLSMTQNFEIQPKEQNNMWAIPSLLQKKQFPIYVGLPLICIIIGLGMIFSLPFYAICLLNDGEN